MIARPKLSRNEWKPTEIGAFEVEMFAAFSCPVRDSVDVGPDDARAAGDGAARARAAADDGEDDGARGLAPGQRRHRGVPRDVEDEAPAVEAPLAAWAAKG